MAEEESAKEDYATLLGAEWDSSVDVVPLGGGDAEGAEDWQSLQSTIRAVAKLLLERQPGDDALEGGADGENPLSTAAALLQELQMQMEAYAREEELAQEAGDGSQQLNSSASRSFKALASRLLFCVSEATRRSQGRDSGGLSGAGDQRELGAALLDGDHQGAAGGGGDGNEDEED